MPRVMQEIEVWGTVVFVECVGANESDLRDGLDEVRGYFEEIDLIFSTYKATSEVSRLRAGVIDISSCSPLMQEVWSRCLAAKVLTDGYFDPWCVEGGFDPSGFVKGWAADRAVEILKSHGATSIQVNAAGDLALAGGNVLEPWKIGVRDPKDAHTVLKVFEMWDGAIATSGTYEKGAHIRDPFSKLIAIGALSATVVGPDGGICEALATALIVAGKDGAYLFGKPELAQYSAWVINRHEDSAWEVSADSFK